LIGAPLTGKTIIIDDVITAGVAFGEAKKLIDANGGSVTAVIIALDRCERGHSNQSTLKEIEALGIRVISIITLFDLMDYLEEQGDFSQYQQIKRYQEKYGY